MYEGLKKSFYKQKKIITNTENITEALLSHCLAAMEEVKKKLNERLEELLKPERYYS